MSWSSTDLRLENVEGGTLKLLQFFNFFEILVSFTKILVLIQ